MTLHLRARAFDPQIFRRQIEALAIVEGDAERLLVLAEPQFGRPGLGGRSVGRRSHLGPAPVIAAAQRQDHSPAGFTFAVKALYSGGRVACDDNTAPDPRFTHPAERPALVDPFARAITYLRVSVTDRCDFRCVYCMSEHMAFLPKADLLTLEELDRTCSAFVARGRSQAAADRRRAAGAARDHDAARLAVAPSPKRRAQ